KSLYRVTFEDPEHAARQVVTIDALRPAPLRSQIWVRGALAYDVHFEDHRQVGGVLVPHKIRYLAPADGVDMLVLYTDVTVNAPFRDRRGEARPAGAGVELHLGVEERLPARRADEYRVFLVIVIFPRKRVFRAFLAKHAKLFRRQNAPPFGLRLDDFLRVLGRV